MPEIPDLEVIREVLTRRVVGQVIEQVKVVRPIVLRVLAGGETPESLLQGQTIEAVERKGKFLLLSVSGGAWMAINMMLAGALRLCARQERVRARDYVLLHLSDGSDLRYYDPRAMGKVYLTRDLDSVPAYAEMGPDALDPTLTEEAFIERLRRFQGEIKGVLTRGALVAGIGNAYADEILYAAGIYPFRKRSTLSLAEQGALYRAMRQVLAESTAVVRERMGEAIDVKVRDFLRVHGKAGEPCPRCDNTISEIKVAQRATNFCRQCQPGTLFRGT
jgi:formamidopyrimidine-DNA glycosylase